MNYFAFTDYKTALKEAVAMKKKIGGRQFTFGKVAAACSVRKAYLSRVLADQRSHLSEEQLFNACHFLGMTQVETNFLIMLRSYQRSTSQAHRESLEQQINFMRKEYPRVESTLKISSVAQDSSLMEFFLDTEAMLVHSFLSIENYARNSNRIAKDLLISEQRLQEILTKLERMRIIELDQGKYKLLKEDLHLPTSSSFYPQFQLLQRISNFRRCQKLDSQKSYSYSVTFSADEKTRNKIKQKFLDFLKETHELVRASPCEKVYQLAFDLFDWC